MTDPNDRLERLVRDEGRIILATLVRTIGDLQLAEDAVQDASIRALRVWRGSGVPENPRAWLIVTARNRAIDLIRRERLRFGKEKESMDQFAAFESDSDPTADGVALEHGVLEDDQLRLIFLCCHPALDPAVQIALALRVLCGLTVAEVADALLVSEEAMAKRLSRARSKIRVAKIPYIVPADDELPARFDAVAAVLFLMFNEGYASRQSVDVQRPELAREALRLARVLEALMPGDASAEGLLATLLLQHSRRAARINGEELVLLADQDRSLWDAAMIEEGINRAAHAIRLSSVRPSRYAVTAAIAASHVLADDAGGTDWADIVAWYDVLVTLDPSPVVRLNRAVAIAERDDAAAGLAAMDGIDELERYPWFHASRGELLVRAGRTAEAAVAFERALDELAAPAGAVRTHFEARLNFATAQSRR